MQEIGNFNGPDPLRTDEENTHWGLWCIISAPLILGADLSVKETVDRIWPTITNADALMINDAWAGHPGTLVKSYPATDSSSALMLDQASCDGSAESTGWSLDGGKLRAPGGQQCLDGLAKSGPTGQSDNGMVSCPPPTTKCGSTPCPGCGALLVNCTDAQGAWTHDAGSGVLMWNSTGPDEAAAQGGPGGAKCLSARPSSGVGGFYGGPKAALTSLGNCPKGGTVANTSSFSLSATGELKAGSGACIVARAMFGPQLWSKPLPDGKVAVLVVNIAETAQDFELPLADVPGLSCGGSCAVRDVWAGKDLPPQAKSVAMALRTHQSGFYILGPAKAVRNPSTRP